MRPIDADVLTNDIERRWNTNDDMDFANKEVWKALEEAPTIDAVQVIRCKDCKWFNRFGCAVEIVDFTDKPAENDYCSFGERKDDE